MWTRTNTIPTISCFSSTQNILCRIPHIKQPLLFHWLRRKYPGITLVLKDLITLCIWRLVMLTTQTYFLWNKVHFLDTLPLLIFFWDTAVPCGTENSNIFLHLSPNKDEKFLLTLRSSHLKACAKSLGTQIYIYST